MTINLSKNLFTLNIRSNTNILNLNLCFIFLILTLQSKVFSETWNHTAALNNPRSGGHTATLLLNGKVLIAGGQSSSVFSSAELFDPSKGNWSDTGSMRNSRLGHTATLLPNGKVLVAGGYNGIILSGVEIYDPSTGIWSSAGSMNSMRTGHTATLLTNGKVLVVGGEGNFANIRNDAELYDPITGVWTRTGSMNNSRWMHKATLLANGNVLVTGGREAYHSGELSTATLFDATTGAWSNAGSMNSSRIGHSATLLNDGTVLVAGGWNGSSAVDTVNLFNPVTGNWSNTASLSNPCENHTATLLTDGRLLLAGGRNGETYFSRSDLYNPDDGIWTNTTAMSNARCVHSSTMLADGRVLVAGGSNINGAISSVEIFNLLTNYTVTIALSPQGAITGNSSPYLENTTATLNATPQLGYKFTGWTGDASGTTNPLTITMDADKTIGATFEKDLSDTDSDGLTAYDELVVYATNPGLADTDGDGLSDGYELGVGRFSILTGSFTWQQARNDARSKGGDLASFPTEDRWDRALQNLAANPFEDFTGLWIGASDAALDGSWTWVNGEAFSFAPWGTGRPTSTAGNTLDFAEVSGGGGAEIGKWYDRSSTTIRDGYLLEIGYATNPLVADTDADGLNDGQELAADTNPRIADTDGDGWNDGAEQDFGGDPRSADISPIFQCDLNRASNNNQWILSFPSALAQTYTIEESVNLSSWHIIESNIMGDGNVVSRSYPNAQTQAKRFFRVKRN
jgi:uncharacterized repeat protein (TIGR02543 family)